ncbi:hypothetical protein ACJ5NV_20405 [Loktanella agnita]|uniref:hypothetical protein n=1 Tax=Loktanella agnita TaxID=287097 RepID=UPI00398963AD
MIILQSGKGVAGGHFEKEKSMKKLTRCAVVALMLTPAVSTAQAQEMRPLGELFESAAAPYGQDELIKSDMFVCQLIAELAVATVGDLDQ